MLLFNGLAIITYLTALLLQQNTGIQVPLNLIGLFLLIFLVPLNISYLLPKTPSSYLDKFFLYLVIFFFLYVPAYYILHRIFSLPVNTVSIFLLNTIILIAVPFLLKLTSKENSAPIPLNQSFWLKNAINHLFLLISLSLYAILHGINFFFYKFMPEWDGYTDLMNIENFVATGVMDMSYRGFFYMANTIIASFAFIDPYNIFTFWLIALQAVLMIVLYQFARTYDLKPYVIAIILLSALAVPVINMEIDMVRPQNIVIIFFPIYFYFLYKALTNNHFLPWAVSSIIAIGGLNYHEFFVFIFLIHAVWLLVLITKKYLIHTKTRKDKVIFALAASLVVSIFLHLQEKAPLLGYASSVSRRIFSMVADTSNWRWWFISQYQTDGEHLQMGWPGWEGAMQYYAYYVSPVVFVILFLTFLAWRKMPLHKDKLILSLLPILLVFFSFSEILPRLNFVLLPERFWLFSVILLLMASIPAWAAIQKYYSNKTVTFILSLTMLAIVIGIGGSFYIAHAKGSLTTPHEYTASQWMNKNTSDNAVFVTQTANAPMVKYFAKRTILVPSEEFFLGEEIIHLDTTSKLDLLEQQLSQEYFLIQEEFNRLVENDFAHFQTFLSLASQNKARIEQLKKEINRIDPNKEENLYVLYSKDKFNTLYTAREWWLKSNFYGANLDKFHETYPLVYAENDIYIWQVE